jgi:hypothetical protein
MRVGPGLAERGEQLSRQHGDAGDDHQQFDPRETGRPTGRDHRWTCNVAPHKLQID